MHNNEFNISKSAIHKTNTNSNVALGLVLPEEIQKAQSALKNDEIQALKSLFKDLWKSCHEYFAMLDFNNAPSPGV